MKKQQLTSSEIRSLSAGVQVTVNFFGNGEKKQLKATVSGITNKSIEIQYTQDKHISVLGFDNFLTDGTWVDPVALFTISLSV